MINNKQNKDTGGNKMKLKDALNILKPTEKNLDSLKDAFRKAARKYHPDHGGDVEVMKLVNAAYETLKDRFTEWTAYQARAAVRNTEPNIADSLLEKINRVRHLAGIKIEVIGTWIWITGDTKPAKELFKDLGFKFSGRKLAWYYHEGGFRKASKKKFDLDDIRYMFGTEEIETETASSVAA
jgi:hypothetical protein